MPIKKTTAPIKYPDKNHSLVKYYDLTKFLSLLSTKSLFFCRLDKLEDRFEGLTTKGNRQARRNWYKNFNASGTTLLDRQMTEDEIEKKIDEYCAFEKRFKGVNLVNCWNMDDKESAALWKIYSDNGKGIMLKTDVNSLFKSLEKTAEDIWATEVVYIDYQKEVMPDGNTFYPLYHKQQAYHYENELRLLHEIKSGAGFTYDWSKERIQEGRYLSVDLDILIHELVIGPYTPVWVADIIHETCGMFGLKKKISSSALTFFE